MGNRVNGPGALDAAGRPIGLGNGPQAFALIGGQADLFHLHPHHQWQRPGCHIVGSDDRLTGSGLDLWIPLHPEHFGDESAVRLRGVDHERLSVARHLDLHAMLSH